MTKEEIVELRHRLAITQETLGQAIGVGVSTINRLEKGRCRPSRLTQRLLTSLDQEGQSKLEELLQAPEKVPVLTGNQIKSLRINLDMTQEEFAHEIGVTVSSVNRWENNHVLPSRLALKAMGKLETIMLPAA